MILKTGTVLLCMAALFVVLGITVTEAADISLGGGMNTNFYSALSGNNYKMKPLKNCLFL